MRTDALIHIRLPRQALSEALPASLQNVAQGARDGSPGYSQAKVQLTPEQLETLLRWGRERVRGATRIRLIRLYFTYSREEFGPGPVELLNAPDVEPAEVLNRAEVVEGRWACTHCDRVEERQVGSLEVTELDPGSDLQRTATGETILTRRLAPEAKRLGIEICPLASESEFVQAVTPPCIRIVPVFPVVPVGPRCIACNWQPQDRSDFVEGSLSADGETGLVVAQEWPLTLEPTDSLLGQSSELLDWRGRVSEAPIHRAGERLPSEELARFTSGTRPTFMAVDVWDALVAAGARVRSPRPVKQGEAPPRSAPIG